MSFSIMRSEMCSLHLTHPSAHTPGAVVQMLTDGLECDVLIRFSIWRHPFIAEHSLTLILTAPIHYKASIDSHSDGTHSLQSIHWLSFWRHPFTAEHPLTLILTAPVHWCSDTFLQNRRTEDQHIFIADWTSPLEMCCFSLTDLLSCFQVSAG